MSVKRGGLGRNLSALLSASSQSAKSDPLFTPLSLDLTKLKPGKYQPRRHIDEASIGELSASIAKQGLLQPLVVRPLDQDHYEIIAGERRFHASKRAGLKSVPVIVRDVNDETAMALALIENLQREDLNPIDEARALSRLSNEFQLTHQQIAELVSKSRTTVTNQLRLLNLIPEVISFLEQGVLDMGHARTLLSLEPNLQLNIANLIIQKQLSVREAEKLVQLSAKSPKTSKAKLDLPHSTQNKIHQLAGFLESKIQVKTDKNGHGSLIIHYSAMTELDNLIEKILGVDMLT